MDHDGGCLCGQVRYRVTGSPIIFHACHCTRCQSLTGSAFALNAMIEADRVTLLHGAPLEHEIDGGHVWARCPTCHVGLWSRHPQLGPSVTLIAAGTLDDPTAMPPDVHCFTASAHPWVRIPSGLPSFPGDYDVDAVWSDEAKARLHAVLG